MTSERDAARAEFETMRKQRLDEFMAGFSIITNKLKEMYQVSEKWRVNIQVFLFCCLSVKIFNFVRKSLL